MFDINGFQIFLIQHHLFGSVSVTESNARGLRTKGVERARKRRMEAGEKQASRVLKAYGTRVREPSPRIRRFAPREFTRSASGLP